MIGSLLEIGKYSLRKKEIDISDTLQILIENPNSSGNYKDVICLVLQKEGTDFELNEIKIEEFDSKKIDRYFYKKGSSSGSDYSLTSRITAPEKTISRFERWVKKAIKVCDDLSDSEKQTLENLQTLLVEGKDNLVEGVEKYLQNISDNAILTVKIQDGDIEKYVGEIELFRKVFRNRSREKLKKISENNQVCSACGERKEQIYGNQTPYKFYTQDKPGYVCGLIKGDWKDFPLCEDCALILGEGRNYIEKNMNFRFYGLRYYIFPRLILDNKEAREEVNDILELAVKKQKIGDAKKITADEDEILDSLKEFKDYLCYDFLFMQRSQSAERILLTIEDVLPSRLRTIFNAKDSTDRRFGEKFPFNFGRIRTFLSKSDEEKRNYDLDKYFLEVVNKVFKGLKIDRRFMMQMYMKKIRRDFATAESNSDNFFYHVRDAIVSLDFMSELGVIQFEEDGIMEANTKFEDFFAKYSQTFNTNLKKGIFLLGSLTQDLLKIQKRERDSMPFYKQLKGLRMSERDIKGLLPKVQNKMQEYESFSAMRKTIANNISKYLMSAGDNWALTVDEINFYFSAGMNMMNDVYAHLRAIIGGKNNEQQTSNE